MRPTIRFRARIRTSILGLALAATLASAPGVAPGADQTNDLSSMSIEELLAIEVTSVSKHAQKISEAPAAVTVLTGEDIRRSGMTTIADVLRAVPGLHVASIDASTRAITARGFNSQFANKLLVMIDGRTVYTPLFSGVYWDVQDVMLEDIDRIEIVRGPGGAVWGANAVNGVINIITRRAEETQGILLTSGGGSLERSFAGGRYGGAIGDDAHYRAYVKYFDRSDYDDGPMGAANDAWNAIRGGLRFDWSPASNDALTLQGDYYDGRSDEANLIGTVGHADVSGGNVLARWRHEFSERSDASLQFYYDRTERHGVLLGENRDTVDVEFQHNFRPFERHGLAWGGAYRMTSDEMKSSSTVSFDPVERTDHLFSLFLQDEITVVRELVRLTLGTKLEHNDYSGFEFQPSARLLVTPHERHTVWAAVSRAVRAPSRAEDDITLLVPSSPTMFNLLMGSNAFESEDLLAYELGYRTRPFDQVTFDFAGYYNVYHDLRSMEPGAPIFNFPFPGAVTIPVSGDNRYDARAWGLELSSTWSATSFWRLTAGYTLMKVSFDADADSLDPVTDAQENDTPDHQFFLLSRLDLPWRLEFDTSFFYVGDVVNQSVGSYVRLDARLGWRPTRNLELSVVGQNLTEHRHMEYGPSFTRIPSAVPRSVYGKVAWRY